MLALDLWLALRFDSDSISISVPGRSLRFQILGTEPNRQEFGSYIVEIEPTASLFDSTASLIDI